MKIVAISDTHLRPMPNLGEGDILVHCGDATMSGTAAEIERFGRWFGAQKFKHKIFVPGNHDFLFEENRQEAEALLPDDVDVLIDEAQVFDGIRFYGTPWVPNLPRWAFHLSKRRDFAHVPPCDVLLTHGPARGILDDVPGAGPVGSLRLLRRIREINPAYHFFGHIHEHAGKEDASSPTVHVNVCAVDKRYHPLRAVGYELNL